MPAYKISGSIEDTEMARPEVKTAIDARSKEWAVILAGGDGTRLKSLTRHIAGDERPKQFCSVLGHRTLLEETRGRSALELAPGHGPFTSSIARTRITTRRSYPMRRPRT